MSTTVIASRHGATLYLAPWRANHVDVAAVRNVAAAHGVDLFAAELLNTQLEAIVAVGLDPAEAGRFAAALRKEGLTVRVVNDPTIHQSARLSTAASILFLAAMLLLPLVLPTIVALFHAFYILSSGTHLSIAGAASKRPLLAVRTLDRLRSLGDRLPPHVLEPLLLRTEALAEEAAADPRGPANEALQALLSDLNADGEAEVVSAGSSLRSDLAQARRAVRELA